VRIAALHAAGHVLTDGYLANGAEPWRCPTSPKFEPIKVEHPTEPNAPNGDGATSCPTTATPNLARPWAIPGTRGWSTASAAWKSSPITGNVSYDPD
jgi:2-oxoglutarate ferredoxin oxidoreductase subunit alpha